MKKHIIFIAALLALPAFLSAQAQQATLRSIWDDPTIVGSAAYNNRYNEVWSVAVNGHEYAIVGSTKGTHFIDVSNPSSPFEAAFVPGKAQGSSIIHRDYKTYKHYIYGVCDEGASSLQIMDISTLPDAVTLVSNSSDIIVTTHNISIDTSKGMLYAWVFGGADQYGYGGMAILDLANPEQPVFVKKYNNIEAFSFSHIHDGFVRNDTAYLDAGNNGFAMVDFSNPQLPQLLGTMTGYPGAGYNHSGWLSEDGQYYYMADETHGSPVKTVDVRNVDDIQVVDSYNAESTQTQIPHNPVLACQYLYVSYYYDGLQVYDVSDPASVTRVLYYDTSTEPDGNNYKGAWGVNPFLPSGIILVADMQNGLYVFQGIQNACNSSVSNTTLPKESEESFKLSPQPASDVLMIDWQDQPDSPLLVTLLNGNMQTVFCQYWETPNRIIALPELLANGMYFLKIQTGKTTVARKVLVQH
jgi:choice-of-anchor B domain-containing protein